MSAKKIPILFLLLTAILPVSNLRADDIDAFFVSKAPVIDGDRADWNDIPIFFNEDNNTAYGLCHDSTSFYILFSFNSPIYASLIKQKGLNIWINTKNKKDDDYGISYSGGPNREQIKKMSGPRMPDRPEHPEGTDDRSDERNDRPNRPEAEGNPNILKIHFKDKMDEALNLNESKDFQIAYRIINGICAYELKIPIEKFQSEYNKSFSEIKKMKFGFEWGGMKMQRPDKISGRGGGMPRGGMGGGRGDDFGGIGPGSIDLEMRDQMAELKNYMNEQKIWITYKLK